MTPAAMIAPVLSSFLTVVVLSAGTGAGFEVDALTLSDAAARSALRCEGVTASGSSEIRRTTALLQVSLILPPSETQYIQAWRSSGRSRVKASVPE